MTYVHRLARTVPAVFTLALILLAFTAAAAFAQAANPDGSSPPPDAAQPSRPSPETGRRSEPGLVTFILVGGGLISLIAVILTDRAVRAQHGRPSAVIRTR